ncbi:hypothetical protein Bra471DRAFT_05926 [Bradyrhizobium sp. WSM471]|nr:hypothetical protein Bra471DRAFT_05926 [Bradyrhizobium sp. WSM471]
MKHLCRFRKPISPCAVRPK